jgi:pimeloyl-ACP methyl ester carboxylesterase
MDGMTRRAALFACCASAGCAHIDVKLGSFMSPDRSVSSARLPAGYSVENRILHSGGQSTGLTYARHPLSRVAVLYCGGSGFHRSTEGAVPLQALALGANVAEFDYPGYGDSTGLPSTTTILDSAITAYDHVFDLATSMGKKRVLYGFSLGGMVAAHLAQDRPADAVILEATAATVRGWARRRVPFALRPLVRIRIEPQIATLNSATALDQFRGTIVLLVSRADEVVPARASFDMARQLEKAQRDVRVFEFARRRHGSIMNDPTFPGRLSDFFERLAGVA